MMVVSEDPKVPSTFEAQTGDNGEASSVALQRVLSVIEEFRKINPRMEMQTAVCLLLVAMRPGISQVALANEIGLVASSMSRNVGSLTARGAYNDGGYDLITSEEDPENRRYKVHHLTTKGKLVMKALTALVKDG